MRNQVSELRSLSFLLALVTLPACGGTPEAPEGYQLVVQLESVRVEAVDQLRITIDPDESMAIADFQDIEAMTDENGITVDVDGGRFILTAPGEYVRANADVTDPNNPRITFEVWTDDELMRRGPLLTASVTRAAEVIANGTIYLPTWPVELGQSITVHVPCFMASTARCLP